MHHRNERRDAREAKHFTPVVTARWCGYFANAGQVCKKCGRIHDGSDSDFPGVMPSDVGVQPATSIEYERRLAAMFAGDDDSLALQPSAKEQP